MVWLTLRHALEHEAKTAEERTKEAIEGAIAKEQLITIQLPTNLFQCDEYAKRNGHVESCPFAIPRI